MYRSGKGSQNQRRDAQYERTRRRKRIKQEEKQQRRRREQEEQAPTVEARYALRRARFIARFGRLGRPLHRAAWLVHNNLAHPLLGIAPGAASLHLHDMTARWLSLQPTITPSPHPEIPRRTDWLLHNCVSHPLMGVMPAGRLFSFHDTTADRMDVADWV